MTDPRYSRVSRRVWSDPKFLALSSPPPSARELWIYLLTCEHQGSVPGLFRAGVGAVSDGLGWTYEDVSSLLAELEGSGLLKRSIRPPLVWLPNAARHNQPNGPNQATAWGNAIHELPECPLRSEAIRGIFKAIRSQPCRAAFKRASPMASPMASDRPSAMPCPIQEQEQEQEQEAVERAEGCAPTRETSRPPPPLPEGWTKLGDVKGSAPAPVRVDTAALRERLGLPFFIPPAQQDLWLGISLQDPGEVESLVVWATTKDRPGSAFLACFKPDGSINARRRGPTPGRYETAEEQCSRLFPEAFAEGTGT